MYMLDVYKHEYTETDTTMRIHHERAPGLVDIGRHKLSWQEGTICFCSHRLNETPANMT